MLQVRDAGLLCACRSPDLGVDTACGCAREQLTGRFRPTSRGPSPSNMRTLIRLGLTGGSHNRLGTGNGQEPQSLPPEATDPVTRSSGSPNSELQVGMQGIQNAGEQEVLALFRSSSADKRKTVPEIMYLVIAISVPDS